MPEDDIVMQSFTELQDSVKVGAGLPNVEFHSPASTGVCGRSGSYSFGPCMYRSACLATPEHAIAPCISSLST